MAGQIQMLEAARLRLEMCMEQMRKEYKKEVAQRDDEMEDIRCSAQKKVKGISRTLTFSVFTFITYFLTCCSSRSPAGNRA